MTVPCSFLYPFDKQYLCFQSCQTQWWCQINQCFINSWSAYLQSKKQNALMRNWTIHKDETVKDSKIKRRWYCAVTHCKDKQLALECNIFVEKKEKQWTTIKTSCQKQIQPLSKDLYLCSNYLKIALWWKWPPSKVCVNTASKRCTKKHWHHKASQHTKEK